MRRLRRAVSSKEWLIALLFVMLVGRWLGWRCCLQQAAAQLAPEQDLSAIDVAQPPTDASTDRLVTVDETDSLEVRVAQAVDLRCQLDLLSRRSEILDDVDRLRQALAPLYEQPTEPQDMQARHQWRRGLATLVDAEIIAGDAGDTDAEPRALALMQRCCPADAWSCYFQIPEKAMRVARTVQSSPEPLDDHARVALLTAAGFLYVKSDDRLHGDALLRKAVEAYGRLLEDYDAWEGEPRKTITPRGRLKDVRTEFYTYRNRMNRLAMYCADYWGRCAVEGKVALSDAVAACDNRLFRAVVRVRADRDTNPIRILHDEHIRLMDYITVADWFPSRTYDPQADWELDRVRLIERVGLQEVAAMKAVAAARELVRQERYDEAADALATRLQTEPDLAETGITLRCETADALMRAKRYADALPVLQSALDVMQHGDAYLGRQADRLKGRILFYQAISAAYADNLSGAIHMAEQMVDDETITLSVRLSMLRRLSQFYVYSGDPEAARATFTRLVDFPAADEQIRQMRDAFAVGARSFLERQEVLPGPAGSGSTSATASTQPALAGSGY